MASSTNVTAAIILQAIVPNETNLSATSTVAASSSSLDRSGYSRVEVVFISIVLVSIIVGTIVGNVLVCVAVCLVRKLRRPCNYLLVSLAVSDLCVAILVMPMATFYEVHGRWIFGEIICNLWVSIDVLSCTASILNLCMISVDRYYAITKPLEYGVKRTPRRMILWVILVWCFAACISLPPLLILGNEHWEESEDGDIRYDVCLVSQNFGYQLYATMCSFYIPLAVMMVVYYKIFRAARRIVHEEKRAQSHLESHCYLEISVKNGGGPPENKISSQSPSPANPSRGNHRSSSGSTNTMCSFDRTTLGRCFKSRHSNESQCPMLSMKPSSKPNQKNASKSATTHILPHLKTSPSNTTTQKKLRFQLAKERKASTTLGIIMSAFTFCWLPFFVLALVRPFLEATNALKTLATLFLWLGYANSLLNPIIYATLNRDFRKPFQAILYCRCGSLNNMMREEFYHSQYGDPDHHINRLTVDYEEGVEYIEAEGDQIKLPETDAAAHESFL